MTIFFLAIGVAAMVSLPEPVPCQAAEPPIRVAVYDSMGARILEKAVADAPQKGIMAVLKEMPDVSADYIGEFSRTTLDKYDLLILCQTGQPEFYLPLDWAETVRGWVEDGHGLYVTHDAVGYRLFPALFPAIAAGASNAYKDRTPFTREWCVAREHPLTRGLKLKDRFTLSFYDTIVMTPGDQGTVVMRTAETAAGRNAMSGAPALVCGEPGKGRYVANGAYIGGLAPDGAVFTPTGGELLLLQNAVRWLARREPGGKTGPDIGQDPAPSPASRIRTIQGLVYEESAAGQPGAGRRGLPRVTVSDGLSLARTDDQGRYRLAIPAAQSNGFIFVVTPAGYKAGSGGFFRPLPELRAELDLDFGLVPAPERGRPDFSFLHITDPHARPNAAYAAALNLALKDCEESKPAFIVATGDLTVNYQPEQFTSYIESCATIPTPVFPCVGNHDVPYFKKYFGPASYAFDAGQAHFIVLNSETGWDPMPRQLEWLKRDLEMQPTNTVVFVFQHQPPADYKLPYWGSSINLMEFLALYNVKAIFTGHWHSSRVLRYADKLLSVNTMPLCFGGEDGSPRGFVRVSVDGDRVKLDQRLLGYKQAVTIVQPAAGSVVAAGSVPFLVNAYDAAAPAPAVDCQLDEGAWRPMAAQGKWSFRAVEAVSPGAHRFKVRVRWSPGVVTEKQAAFTVAANAGAAPRPGADWPMFKRDPARTSGTDETVRPPLRLAWSQNPGGTVLLSSPVMANGMVYLGVADEDAAGHAGVVALDAHSGERTWVFPTASSVKHTVAVANGLVYAMSVEGLVYALDALTGECRWTNSLGSAGNRWAYAAPLVDGHVVYVGVAPHFVALDAKTGELLWQATKMGEDWISCPSSPATDGSNVYVATSRGSGFFALNRQTGKAAWKQGFLFNLATPAVNKARGIVYHPAVSDVKLVGDTWVNSASLYALSANSTHVLWSFPLGDNTLSSPALSGSRLFLGLSDGQVLCLNADTGEEIWATPCGEPANPALPMLADNNALVSSPAISGNVVYIGALNGRLLALNAGTGGLLGSFELGAPILSSPAISGNMVVISAADGGVYAFTGTAERPIAESAKTR